MEASLSTTRKHSSVTIKGGRDVAVLCAEFCTPEHHVVAIKWTVDCHRQSKLPYSTSDYMLRIASTPQRRADDR